MVCGYSDRPLKIGLISACYLPVTNGVTRMVASYTRAFRERGHEVTIFTLGAGISENRPGVENVIYSPGLPLGKSGYHAALRYSSTAQQALASQDIIHAHHLLMGLEFSRRYSQGPVVYTNHTRYDLYAAVYSFLRPRWLADWLGRKVGRLLWGRLSAKADLIIAPTPAIARIMQRYGANTEIQIIPNGINLSLFTNPADSLSKNAFNWRSENLVAVYCGRLAPEKNLSYLLAQFGKALQKRPELRLLLIGDGPSRPELEHLIQRNNLQPFVYLTGEIAHPQLPRYLAAADLFVTASVSEVDPLTVLEAMGVGLPVFALDAEWLDCYKQTGAVLAAAPNGDDLAWQLSTQAFDPIVRRSLAEAGRELSQKRSFSKTADKTLEIYRALLK